jgi:hypothetical protein
VTACASNDVPIGGYSTTPYTIQLSDDFVMGTYFDPMANIYNKPDPGGIDTSTR